MSDFTRITKQIVLKYTHQTFTIYLDKHRYGNGQADHGRT